MLYLSRKYEAKTPHRGAGALFAASSVLAVTNAAAIESTGNTVMDTIRYGVSTVLLGGMAVVSFLKFGRNFEATTPSVKESPAPIPKEPDSSRGAGPLFVISSFAAAATAGAVETLSSLGDARNGATALLLGGMAATSLVKRLRNEKVSALQPHPYHFAEVGAHIAEFPSLKAEREIPGRLSPVIIGGAAAITTEESNADAAAKAAIRAESAAILNQPWEHPVAI